MELLDDYEVVEQVAEDDFARLFIGRRKINSEQVYIKQNINPTKEDVALLSKEGDLLQRLSEYHSIPKPRAFYVIDETNSALVIGNIKGANLEALVAKYGRLQPEAAAWMAERLLGALEYAHSNGIIHCDVKPLNVMLEPKEHDIKLMGWQYALENPHSKSKAIVMPAYAAPEITKGMPPLPESDIYGAGLVLMHALGGDTIKKTLPNDTEPKLADYCNSLLRYDINERPNWDKDNPLERLASLRQEIFGRRHTV